MGYFLVIIKLKINVYYAGDIESMPFIEALGQFSYRVGKKNKCRMLF
jgi:CTP synthase (UTP-ammonia lyase)